MTRPMNSRALPDVEEAAEAVLKGERKAKLKNTMYFHTAGLRFPYKNMHYTMVAGGNAFYEKRGRNWRPLPDDSTVAVASAAPQAPATPAPVTLVASAEPLRAAGSGPVKATPIQPTLTQATYVTAAVAQPARSTRATSVMPAAMKPPALKPTLVAMQEPMEEPDAARFGGLVTAKATAQVITSFPDAPAQPAMSFELTPENTDAIGAMIASQSRPLEAY